MKFFGDEYPRDRSLREECLKRFYTEHGEDDIPLMEFEDFIADQIEKENGGFWESANSYATQGYQTLPA